MTAKEDYLQCRNWLDGRVSRIQGSKACSEIYSERIQHFLQIQEDPRFKSTELKKPLHIPPSPPPPPPMPIFLRFSSDTLFWLYFIEL